MSLWLISVKTAKYSYFLGSITENRLWWQLQSDICANFNWIKPADSENLWTEPPSMWGIVNLIGKIINCPHYPHILFRASWYILIICISSKMLWIFSYSCIHFTNFQWQHCVQCSMDKPLVWNEKAVNPYHTL